MARNVTTTWIKKKERGPEIGWVGKQPRFYGELREGSAYGQSALFEILEELKTEKNLKYFYVLLNLFYYSAKCG